jgi:hypothetical protein
VDLALNELSRSSGALFVVASGNMGQILREQSRHRH